MTAPVAPGAERPVVGVGPTVIRLVELTYRGRRMAINPAKVMWVADAVPKTERWGAGPVCISFGAGDEGYLSVDQTYDEVLAAIAKATGAQS